MRWPHGSGSMTGRFKGSPMAAHARASGILDEHFALWLDLFGRTARDVCPPAAAALFIEKSRMIGRSLRMGLAVSRGAPIADLTAL